MANTGYPILALSQSLYTCSRLLIQLIQKQLNDFGLTYPQFLVLSILWKEDGLKVHELGKHLKLDSGTLTPILKKLESQNLLRRKRGEVDERTVSIQLTYPGKSLQNKVMEVLRTFEGKSIAAGDGTSSLLATVDDFMIKLNSVK